MAPIEAELKTLATFIEETGQESGAVSGYMAQQALQRISERVAEFTQAHVGEVSALYTELTAWFPRLSISVQWYDRLPGSEKAGFMIRWEARGELSGTVPISAALVRDKDGPHIDFIRRKIRSGIMDIFQQL